jgi:VIT1/CCC1 family predicted Fe2+/Mn2+ transporter
MSDNGRYLGDAVYGALDGIVTTFAIVAGVQGASLASSIVLVLGVANLLADGVSMGAGSYLSKRSEEEYRSSLPPPRGGRQPMTRPLSSDEEQR